jgi:uncharacterized membrane-anchored protein
MENPLNPSIAEIEASLAISEVEIARGETAPLAPILKRLHEHADRLEAKAANSLAQRVASRPGSNYRREPRWTLRDWKNTLTGYI